MSQVINKSTKEILRDFMKIVPFMKENNPSIDIAKTRQMIIKQFKDQLRKNDPV